MAEIKHVFVLAMENRSFDHVFGLSGLNGVQPPDPSWKFLDGAPDRMTSDPPHEFEDVRQQILPAPGDDRPMSGFTSNPSAMQGFGPGTLSVLSQLAQEFVLFDNWYSSVPGPTWPNRFFIHAASSGGLDNSPSGITSVASETIDSLGFSFEHGTLFDSLEKVGTKWRVYHADAFPQVLAIKGLVERFFHDERFRRLKPDDPGDSFASDLQDGYDIGYTFIEPDYGLLSGNFSKGNSHHPIGSMSAGESLIRYVYEIIRSSPVWAESLLLITWDEHGGFFDHEKPPAAVPPGDTDLNGSRAAHPQKFEFDSLGVRVPALLISPYATRGGLGSSVCAGKTFDHASIVRAVRETFHIETPLTARDAASPSWAGALLDTPRSAGNDGPAKLNAPAAPLAAEMQGTPAVADPTSSQYNGFADIAKALDLKMAAENATQPAAHDPALFGARIGPQRALQTPGGTAAVPAPNAQTLAEYVAYVAHQSLMHERQ